MALFEKRRLYLPSSHYTDVFRRAQRGEDEPYGRATLRSHPADVH